MKTRFLLLTATAALAFQVSTVHTQQAPATGNRFVADQIVIGYEPWASGVTKSQARGRLRAGLNRSLRDGQDGQIEVANLPPGLSVQAAINALSGMPGVQFAEPNWVYTHEATSNDPGFINGSLWGMLGDASTPANQFGSQAAEAWTAEYTGHSGVYVAVIDEGIDFNHPDLMANIWTNPFDPVDGIDNDGNGFVDDVHGWDFFSNNNNVFDGSAGSSVDAHGTHVAGTIGATGGNGVGVAGVNWNVTIISTKFLGPTGGTTGGAIAALNYLVDLKTRHGLNIVATNNSWGGGGYSQALLDAITRAAKANILFIAAAGNNNRNNDVIANYPSNYNTTVGTQTEPAASYDSVIAVASITSSGARSSFSNYGRNTVDLGAPGSSILSTTPNNTYSFYSGTSMATPHVTGAVALYASMEPTATPSQIRQAILSAAGATPTTSMATTTSTGGRLNISTLLAPPPPPQPPDAPTGLFASAVSSSQINLSWTDQSSNENGFHIQRCSGPGCTSFAEIASVGAGVTSFPNTGLSPNTTFRYRVVAFNDAGSSLPSNEAETSTPPTAIAPDAPSALTATTASSTHINLSWTDQSNNETGFSIERCSGPGCTSFSEIVSVGANVTSFSNTGLAPNTTYRYRVVAVNAAGPSSPSNIATASTSGSTGLPATPSALTGSAGPGSGQVSLSWSDNSANESGFRIFRCNLNSCSSQTQIAELGPNMTSFVDTVPSSGRYLYGVRAFNANGMSGLSNPVTVTVP